jgi:hypothetical protein
MTAEWKTDFGMGPYCNRLLLCFVTVMLTSHKQNKQTPWHESASELHRQSDPRLSAKLVLTFAERWVLSSQRSESSKAVISVF